MGFEEVEAPTFCLDHPLTNDGQVVSITSLPLFTRRKIPGTPLYFAIIIFLHSNVVSLASNASPGGPALCVPQRQKGQIVHPGTGFSFCRLLPPSGPRWSRYNPPPHGIYMTTTIYKILILVKFGNSALNVKLF
jgi:hypothetical protein